MTNLSNYMIII